MLNPILFLVAASNVAQAEEKRLGADTVGLVQTWLTVLDQACFFSLHADWN